ncbi:hypothetical protein M9Y10_020051 [Tritrichomonas musculus]|uniref:Uncharacterized protein n=1 Tax=Tritrichomonas musculus TaxID=1915356 RepID=A0ABR2HF41_9EUKA
MTQIGIRTVWIGGTYDSNKAEQRFKCYSIPCVIAYGSGELSPNQNQRLKMMMGIPNGRLPYEQLF